MIKATVVTGPRQYNVVMLCLAADATVRNRTMPGLMATENSFRAMTAADQQAARPRKVHTVPLPLGGFAELVQQSPTCKKRLQQNSKGAQALCTRSIVDITGNGAKSPDFFDVPLLKSTIQQ